MELNEVLWQKAFLFLEFSPKRYSKAPMSFQFEIANQLKKPMVLKYLDIKILDFFNIVDY